MRIRRGFIMLIFVNGRVLFCTKGTERLVDYQQKSVCLYISLYLLSAESPQHTELFVVRDLDFYQSFEYLSTVPHSHLLSPFSLLPVSMLEYIPSSSWQGFVRNSHNVADPFLPPSFNRYWQWCNVYLSYPLIIRFFFFNLSCNQRGIIHLNRRLGVQKGA